MCHSEVEAQNRNFRIATSALFMADRIRWLHQTPFHAFYYQNDMSIQKREYQFERLLEQLPKK